MAFWIGTVDLYSVSTVWSFWNVWKIEIYVTTSLLECAFCVLSNILTPFIFSAKIFCTMLYILIVLTVRSFLVSFYRQQTHTSCQKERKMLSVRAMSKVFCQNMFHNIRRTSITCHQADGDKWWSHHLNYAFSKSSGLFEGLCDQTSNEMSLLSFIMTYSLPPPSAFAQLFSF